MLRKLWPNRKESTPVITKDGALFHDLFDFLKKQITTPKNADQLIQLSKKVSSGNTDEIFHTYILFEKYLCTFETEKQYTPSFLRKMIGERFPQLTGEEPFSILFLSDAEKKNTIAIEFIFSFLSDSLNQFGQVRDHYFESKLSELKRLKGEKENEDIFRELQFISLDIFQFLRETYGENLAGKIFERNYEKVARRYKELEVFPHLITLIPNEIVKREHLGIFSQAQIEQVFLEKLAESERLNIALHQKIREQFTTQQHLSRNKAMLSSVISSALDAIIICNSMGQIMRWNEAAMDLFGYSEEEVTGKGFIETVLPDGFLKKSNFDPERFLKNPSNPLLNQHLEVTCIKKNRETFQAELTITSFQNGNKYFYTGFIRDITARKQKEEELVRTKERAEQAARAKAQFLSVMSHEIRTPLNAIIGFTELLHQNEPREDQLDDLKMLKFSGENLLSIINDILDFSKLESNKVQLSDVPFNLRELAQSLYQSFAYRAREKKIVFDIEYDEQMPFTVKGDSLRLAQILNNLVSNAIKFTSEGSVKLKINLENKETGHVTTRFSIIDTGIGIPVSKHDSIFEQFTQADSNTTRLFGGTGLGLAISAKLAELMGSRILIDSEEGKGSIFHFTLRFQNSEEQQPVHAEERGLKKEAHSFRDKKILLAEDNLFNANIAKRYITGWGAEMDLALDGEQALKFALMKKYDLILLDVQMPVLDGFSCCREIRKHLADVPIIAVTAAPISEIADEIKECGMNDHISKPFRSNELFGKMKYYLFLNS